MSTPPPPGAQPEQPSYGATPPAGNTPSYPGAGPAYPGSGYGAPGQPPQSGGRPKGKPTLGIIAAVAAVIGVVVGTILTAAGGAALGSSLTDEMLYGDPNAYAPGGSAEQAMIGGTMLSFLGYAVYGILGLWGLIQGIVATVLNRGRGWGIAAIVIAVIGIGPVILGSILGVAATVPYAY